jgi:hypothetical protein
LKELHVLPSSGLVEEFHINAQREKLRKRLKNCVNDSKKSGLCPGGVV